MEEGKAVEAVRDLEEAHRLAPREYLTAYALSRAYAAAGRPADATRLAAVTEGIKADLTRITELTREAERRPWDPGLRLELAELSERLGHPKVAEVWRKAAVAVQEQR